MKIKKTKKVSNKKIIIALVLVIAILGVAALAYFTWQQNDPANVAETHNNSSSKTGDKKETLTLSVLAAICGGIVFAGTLFKRLKRKH